MVQLSVHPLLWLLGCTFSVEPPPLFSEECCSQKTVGELGYTQVAGDTDDFPECEEGCVYEKDGEKGTRFCFKSGDQKSECTESLLDSSYVSVTRSNKDLIFKTDIGTFSCEITSDTLPGENITCSEVADQDAEGAEMHSFFFSKSNGKIEWMCLHTETENIHCDNRCKNASTDCDLHCHKISTPGEVDVLFVEGAEAAEGDGLSDQLDKCGEKCFDRAFLPKDDPKRCTFWTFSFWDGHDHEHEGRQARNHDKKSECGIRNYDPKTQLTTNPDQYAGFPDNAQQYFKGAVFVFEVFLLDPIQCKDKCLETAECRTWTWERENRLCSINVYTPTRKIDISGRRPKPNLISGCIEDMALNWTCPTSANPITTTTTTTTTTTLTTTT